MSSAIRVFAVLAVIAVVLLAAVNYPVLSSLFSSLLSVFLPILIGLALAFVLNLPLRALESLWVRLFGDRRKKLRRFCFLALCLLLLVAFGALLLCLILPQLIETLRSLIARLPEYAARIEGWRVSFSAFLEEKGIPLSLPSFGDVSAIRDAVNGFLEEHGHRLVDLSMELLRGTYRTVIDLILSLVLALYFLAQKEHLCAQAKKLLSALFSPASVRRILRFGTLCQRAFSNFITGQLTEAAIIASLCFLGMLLFRMPYPLLISVTVGITALIPIFGAIIGTGIGALLILLDNPIGALWFVIFIVVLQQLETNLIYPKVVGKSVGLPGLWVLISVTVGSSFGIVGMLVSVPIVSVLYGVVRDFVHGRTETEACLQDEKNRT